MNLGKEQVCMYDSSKCIMCLHNKIIVHSLTLTHTPPSYSTHKETESAKEEQGREDSGEGNGVVHGVPA